MSWVGLTCVCIDMFSPIQVSTYRDLQMGQIWQKQNPWFGNDLAKNGQVQQLSTAARNDMFKLMANIRHQTKCNTNSMWSFNVY